MWIILEAARLFFHLIDRVSVDWVGRSGGQISKLGESQESRKSSHPHFFYIWLEFSPTFTRFSTFYKVEVKTIKRKNYGMLEIKSASIPIFPPPLVWNHISLLSWFYGNSEKEKSGEMNVVRRQIGYTLNNHEDRVRNEYMFSFRARSRKTLWEEAYFGPKYE